MALLFLDFDGVLHPQHEGEPTPVDDQFCHLPRVEAVLRDFPNIEIVISSTWRYQFTFENLLSHFADDIRPRIIGTTLLYERNHYIHSQREREIIDWLAASGRTAEPWAAIDDSTWQFQEHIGHLIACRWYQGFDDRAEQELRIKLCGLGRA
jgi:DNA-binding CsgD family transcriptional regulator